MSKAVVFGASGQLGQCLQALAANRVSITDIVFLPEEAADILDEEKLQKVFEEHTPAFCINCAAYTAVDKAEKETALASRINKDGVENLSRLCHTYGTTLIHISTDFVFSGETNVPLVETDETAPLNVYGQTKLAGEKVISTYIPYYFILRTSWLYSEFGNNFVKTMLRLGKEREELKVIWDQAGTPTYAMDLAACILTLIETNSTAYGTYHYSNEGLTSWYDFAHAIFELSGTAVKVIPVRTSEYVTDAVRPAYSVMDKSKIKKALNLEIPYWRESLARCVSQLTK
ncbi:dTDP-4-dehydrorhamnose reductase [Pontibacter liquoris]|uniref:dTDP-4-dehydrorhamnose reductase n=1 Tax=Pontibacter liquoris TaxID=2905677 RepID=UPI001FA7A4D3|nr:dTDP-4-dehydrorhamnose reductase [Pontibacter liquoris]